MNDQDRAETVRAILELEGLTQQAFASRLAPGLTCMTVSRWVRGVNVVGDAYWELIRREFPAYFE